jgi:hypothetical protein
MRVRVSLTTPFPASKVLLPVGDEVQTISQLKKHIYNSLSTVPPLVNGWRDLRLEIDGFELLGGSGVDVLREGDVVW